MGGMIIVGAMIGAGVGGVVSAQKTGSPWAGAALGAIGGAAGGAALGAAGVGSGISGAGAGVAGAGVDAATAGAMGMAPATAAEAGLGLAGASGAATGAAAAGTGSSLLSYAAPALSMASSVGSLLTQPSMPDMPAPIAPETYPNEIIPKSVSESAIRTPWEISQAEQARRAREQAYAQEQARAQESESAALQELRNLLEPDERYFGPTQGAQSALSGFGGLGQGRPLT